MLDCFWCNYIIIYLSIIIKVSSSRHRENMTAVTVRYPVRIFNSNDTNDLRHAANYSQSLVDSSEKNRQWTQFSNARDLKDLWLYENWFYGMKNGVILESGAVVYSATYLFEYFANWTAIHVEADPEHYWKIGNNRLNAINVHSTFCDEFKSLHYSDIGKLSIRGIVEHMSEEFMIRWHARIYNNVTKIENLPVIQCITVKSFLREMKFNHIDIWILGNENDESVLLGTDLKNVTFNAIVMECGDSSSKNLSKRKIEIVEASGFKCQIVRHTCFCCNDNYSPRSAPEFVKTDFNTSYSKVTTKLPGKLADNVKLMSSVTVRYPSSIFGNPQVWRSEANLNKNLDTKNLSDYTKYHQFSHAQDEEDVWLFENFFYGVEKGLILESGALDGIEFSTSLMFEKYLNWSAIHVEADPDNYAKLTKNRINSVNINAALCSEPKSLVYYTLYKLQLSLLLLIPSTGLAMALLVLLKGS